MVKCATKTVFHGFLRKYCSFLKFCKIKKYSTNQNITLPTHFPRQRFFDVFLGVVEKHSKNKLFTAVMHCCMAGFMWNVCCHFSSHFNNSETTIVFENSSYPSLELSIFKKFPIKIEWNWSELKNLWRRKCVRRAIFWNVEVRVEGRFVLFNPYFVCNTAIGSLCDLYGVHSPKN